MKKKILIFFGILFIIGILFVAVVWMFFHNVLFAVYRIDDDERVVIALRELDFEVDDGDILRYEEVKGYRFRIANVSKQFSMLYPNLNNGKYKAAISLYFEKNGKWFYKVAKIVLIFSVIIDVLFLIISIFKYVKKIKS